MQVQKEGKKSSCDNRKPSALLLRGVIFQTFTLLKTSARWVKARVHVVFLSVTLSRRQTRGRLLGFIQFSFVPILGF